MFETSDSPLQDDGDSIQRMARGELEALGIFYDRHSTLLYSLCLEILGDATRAEPVFLEAMSEIWEKASGYDPSLGSALAWALAIVQRCAVRRLRLLSPNPLGHASTMPLSSDTAPPHGSEGKPPPRSDAEQLCLRGPLSRLPDAQQRVIEKSYFCGLTMMEIASQMGESLTMVKCRLRQGMMSLRDSMEEEA